MKRIFSVLIALSMTLSLITVARADSDCGIELSGIEYVLKKGTRQVNLVTLSNKMEVQATVKNTSGMQKTVKLRVEGYKDGSIVSSQTKMSDEISLSGGAVSDVISVKLGNVKTYCDTLKIYAVTGGSEKKLAVFPYISLGIKLNGKELEEYSDDNDEYTAVLDTPFPYFEVETRSVKQKDLNKGFDYKMPYTRVITVSQTGKDDNHKLKDRTVTIHLDTTSPSIPHISNENMIFWVDAKSNNTDQNKYDMSATVWTDLSGYRNNVDKVFDIWTGKGLKVTSKWDTDRLTVLPQKVAEAVNGGSFAVKFVPSAINEVSGANLCLFGSDNGNFRIFVKKDTGRIYFKWGNARFTPEMASVSIAEAEEKENTITADAAGNVCWYIDGTKKSEKIYSLSANSSVGRLTLSDVKEGNVGSVVFSGLKFFDKALSQEEINNSDILNPDTTMEDWYNNVNAGIALCGRIKKKTDTLKDTDIKYFCLSNDSFVEANKAVIAQNVNESLEPEELDEDFSSYNKVAKLTENAIIKVKSASGSSLSTEELVAYIRNNLPKDISDLLDTIDDSTVAGIKNTVNSTKVSSDAEFDSLIREQLIIASIINPKNYEPERSAERIVKYAGEIGLKLNGYDKASVSKRSEIARKLIKDKPATVSGIEALIASELKGSGSGQTSGGSSGGGGGGGGGGLPIKPSNQPPADDTPTVTIAGFDDMSGSEWVAPALEYMVENGYVSGVGEGKFAPKNNITRSEFVAIISRCEALENADDAEAVFDDVPTDFWGYNSIMSAYRNGIISGVGDRRFDPNGNITRQDIAVILYNVYKKYAVPEEEDNMFADWNEISDYAKEAVGKLHALKILNGYDGFFTPRGLCTRAEAVQAIYSYLQAVNR